LIDDEDYGFDLRNSIGDEITPRSLLAIRAGVRAEALKDERVFSCSVEAIYEATPRRLTVTLSGTSAEGTFALTLAVPAVTIEILKGGAS
jgi:hypothetical protein